MGIFLKLLVTYSIVSMACGGVGMFLAVFTDFYFDYTKTIALLWLGPLFVWSAIFSFLVLASVWA